MNVSAEAAWDSSNNQWLGKTTTYDSWGNALTVTGTNGSVTRLRWDASGRFLQSLTSPPNQAGVSLVESYEWDTRFGVLNRRIDPNGNIFAFDIDRMGRVTGESGPSPDGGRVLLRATDWIPAARGYSVVESVRPDWTSTEDVSQWQWQRTDFDALNREIRTVRRGYHNETDDVVEKEVRFDASGRIRQVRGPQLASKAAKWTVIAYDDRDRPLTATAPDGTVQRTDYLDDQRQVMRTGAAGTADAVTELQSVDAYGRVTRRVRANGTATDYKYLALGDVQGITESGAGRNRHVEFFRDSLGRITRADTEVGRKTSSATVPASPSAAR